MSLSRSWDHKLCNFDIKDNTKLIAHEPKKEYFDKKRIF